MFRIGCSGWNYASWRESFYPKGLPPARWLEHYASVFDTVEVNTTFYRLTKPEVVQEWVNRTPEGFVFAAKASRYLTHIRRLQEIEEGVARYYERIWPLVESGKLGPIVWQFPANFHRDDEVLAHALERMRPGRHCFEFRHPSWFSDPVFELLREREVALVIQDHPERPFQAHELTAGWTFVRFHYGHRGRRGNYSLTEIAEWAEQIRAWSQRAQVWAFYNNDWECFAPRNAEALQRRLAD